MYPANARAAGWTPIACVRPPKLASLSPNNNTPGYRRSKDGQPLKLVLYQAVCSRIASPGRTTWQSSSSRARVILGVDAGRHEPFDFDYDSRRPSAVVMGRGKGSASEAVTVVAGWLFSGGQGG